MCQGSLIRTVNSIRLTEEIGWWRPHDSQQIGSIEFQPHLHNRVLGFINLSLAVLGVPIWLLRYRKP